MPEHELQHDITRQGILEQTQADLDNMSTEQKEKTASRLREIRNAYNAGTLGELSFQDRGEPEAEHATEETDAAANPNNLES